MTYQITSEDIARIKGHDRKTLDVFRTKPYGQWVDVSVFEQQTGSTRVAARIHTLRRHLEIESKRGVKGRAQYRVVGKAAPKFKKPHGASCICHDGGMQSEMQL